MLSLLAFPAAAQIQRSFINLGFEDPILVPASCFVIVTDTRVPGWSTTHFSGTSSGSCTSPPTGETGPLIELWSNGFAGVPSRAGSNFAELNAHAASRLYQPVCLVTGEQVSWQLSHRGREGIDVMSFNIDSTANEIGRFATNTAGAGTVQSCGGGLVLGASCAPPTTINTWADYTGTFTWNGASGIQNFGFEAISTATGNNAVGNLLDQIQIFLTPYLEFRTTSSSGSESVGAGAGPLIAVSGTLATAVTVTIQVTAASTASLGSDYTTPSGTNTFAMTIPAGNYDGGASSQFATGIVVVNDTIIENNETVVMSVVPNPSAYTIASTSTCGAPSVPQSTYTILDNDVDTRTTKAVGNANPAAGGSSVFTVTYQNNTARPTVGTGADLDVHDAQVSIADALPAGFTAFSWTCAATGTPAPVCPAASGTGAISATAILPAGNAAAGGILTYTITGTLDPAQCAATTNTSTVAVLAPMQEGTGVQAGFVTPAPGGVANNTATAVVDPGCLTLSKTTSPAAAGTFGFALTNTALTAATVSTPVSGTAQVDGNAAAGIQPFGIVAPGAAITIQENALPAIYQLASATCSNGTANVGSLSGTTFTIASADVVAGTDFNCSFTNARKTASVALAKTWVGAAINDSASLTATGGVANPTLASIADSANETDTGTAVAVDTGTVFTLTETLGAGNIGLYNPSAWACAGTTGLSGNTLTVGDNDTAIVCTITNTRQQADLQITKTNTPGVNNDIDQPNDTVTRGSTTTYTVVVTNTGPDSVTGALVRDTAGTGIVCPAGNAVTCSGPAGACPAGALTFGDLSAGLALGTLSATPGSNQVTLAFQCNIP
ncbi:beta strand repeat-containing protein [Lysobacter sp. Hz 25]|uniref:beta strand repeat-containing protein n=1 Tax=Lysobacter sp. Hz 25 TaxID=3383698 RepID=UPI0038D37394